MQRHTTENCDARYGIPDAKTPRPQRIVKLGMEYLIYRDLEHMFITPGMEYLKQQHLGYGLSHEVWVTRNKGTYSTCLSH